MTVSLKCVYVRVARMYVTGLQYCDSFSGLGECLLLFQKISHQHSNTFSSTYLTEILKIKIAHVEK